jgi:drug/metabolite transporter (DMT)-like permease
MIQDFGALSVTGWAMLIGGIAFQFVHPTVLPDFSITPTSLLLVAGVILFGTIFAFLIFLSSLKYVDTLVASIAAAFEPMLSTVFSVILFGLVLHPIDIFSIALIIVSVLVYFR